MSNQYKAWLEKAKHNKKFGIGTGKGTIKKPDEVRSGQTKDKPWTDREKDRKSSVLSVSSTSKAARLSRMASEPQSSTNSSSLKMQLMQTSYKKSMLFSSVGNKKEDPNKKMNKLNTKSKRKIDTSSSSRSVMRETPSTKNTPRIKPSIKSTIQPTQSKYNQPESYRTEETTNPSETKIAPIVLVPDEQPIEQPKEQPKEQHTPEQTEAPKKKVKKKPSPSQEKKQIITTSGTHNTHAIVLKETPIESTVVNEAPTRKMEKIHSSIIQLAENSRNDEGDVQNKGYFIGIDVGTGSVRAALVKHNGQILRIHVHEIKTWNIKPDFFEQSSNNIWNAVCICVKNILSHVNPLLIKGIGIDAVSSMVCLDKNGKPLSVSPSGNNDKNVILWLDYRAINEAEEINSTNHPILKFMGGKISPNHVTPKLMWLKKHLKSICWEKAGYFFDLPDFLTWRATGSTSRSICSLACKWNYEININGSSKANATDGWNKSFFDQIGLSDLAENNWQKLGSKILVPGCSTGKGLSERAAKDFGLMPGTPVGTSIIDSHAGGLALICCGSSLDDTHIESRMCMICGTSTTHIVFSSNPVVIPGLWGPYRHVLIPGMWLNEGGQNATGKLIEHIINTHPVTPEIRKNIGRSSIKDYLNALLHKMSSEFQDVAELASDFHVYPDFHGNRSPFNDPSLKGMICGLTLEKDARNLALIYLAMLQAIAYGTRQIIEHVKNYGFTHLKTIVLSGGLSSNKIFAKTLADACNMPVIIPNESESVLLGAAMLGAQAARAYPDLLTTMSNMAGKGEIIYPQPKIIKFHSRKYNVFKKMYEDQNSYRDLMGPKR